jgi:cytochrome c553
LLRSLWIFVTAVLPAVAFAADVTPTWSFFIPDVHQPAEVARLGTYTLPGSVQRYSQAQIDDLKNPPDWFPQAHPPFPAAVIKGGEARGAVACASCHLVSGMGHPESASLAGLPAAYLEQQMVDFKSGARANHWMVNGKLQFDSVQSMVLIAESWPETDVKAAVRYFASLKPQPWVKVVETNTVPRSYIDAGYMRIQAPGSATEPLGQRIVELPQDRERALLRDPNSGTIAYVPVGAISRGKALARGGLASCASCHGANLKGVGNIPSLAGRSPLYLFRQLYFFKEGSRKGPLAGQMKVEVADLSENNMIDLSAYVASLTP